MRYWLLVALRSGTAIEPRPCCSQFHIIPRHEAENFLERHVDTKMQTGSFATGWKVITTAVGRMLREITSSRVFLAHDLFDFIENSMKPGTTESPKSLEHLVKPVPTHALRAKRRRREIAVSGNPDRRLP